MKVLSLKITSVEKILYVPLSSSTLLSLSVSMVACFSKTLVVFRGIHVTILGFVNSMVRPSSESFAPSERA